MESETMIKDQFITLINEINAENVHTIREMTAVLLYNSLCLLKTSKLYLSLLYRLLFHTYKKNPLVSSHMLGGFILLGQTKDGELYKPLIDYFVIEAFKSLQKEYGWAILKPCLTALHTINYRNELLFQYIVSCIVKQLEKDVNELPYNSDLCFHLPREKSFTWGWFSFDIAKAYYAVLFYNRKELRGKELRNVMMLYRKLLTKLRKTGLHVARIPNQSATKIEENWASLLSVLAEYKWANDIVDATLTDCAENKVETNAVEASTSANEVEVVASANEVEAVASANEVVVEAASANEVVVEAASTNAVVAEPELHPSEKNNSWLYKLFGW
jgi:hypothetical protein